MSRHRAALADRPPAWHFWRRWSWSWLVVGCLVVGVGTAIISGLWLPVPAPSSIQTVVPTPGIGVDTATVLDRATADRAAVAAPRTATIRRGDSLWIIARRELGDGTRWKEIGWINHLQANATLTVGDKLTIPRK